MSDAAPIPPKVDRENTTPFLLKLFYRNGAFHRLEEFTPSVSSASSHQHLPRDHLQIYTWPTCSLRELTQLLTGALPSILPSPAIGTRIAFRLVFPDTRPTPGPPSRTPRFSVKELGSVVVGVDSGRDHEINGEDATSSSAEIHLEGEPTKTLADARFVIGDYVCCAVFPPLADGAVAPAPGPAPSSWSSRGGGYGPRGGGPRENGGGGYREGGYRDVGYRDSGFRGRGSGRGSGYGREFGGPDGGLPSGEWRRGERLPEGQRGRGRGGGRDW